jgi:protease-4
MEEVDSYNEFRRWTRNTISDLIMKKYETIILISTISSSALFLLSLSDSKLIFNQNLFFTSLIFFISLIPVSIFCYLLHNQCETNFLESQLMEYKPKLTPEEIKIKTTKLSEEKDFITIMLSIWKYVKTKEYKKVWEKICILFFHYIVWILWSILLVAILCLILAIKSPGYNLIEQNNIGDTCLENTKIATININGEIVPYSMKATDGSEPKDEVSADNVVACINRISKNNTVKGLILRIDSGGGSPEASEEIANAVKGLNKPTVAVIREAGNSGAYLIASATNRIFASEFSDVGSIGVTNSYVDNSQKNMQDGLTFNQLSVGQFKDTLNPDKPLTPEERTLVMRDVNILYQDFMKKVADNRKLSVDKVKQLADGSTMLGLQAKDSGLVDEIGDINSATSWLKSKMK